jgi:lipoprotein-releasing system permease protein
MNFIAVLKDFNLLFLRDRASRWFIFATILGLGFSISIILCTLGLMDGFSHKLHQALNEGHGEIIVNSRLGFFSPKDQQFNDLKDYGVKTASFMIQTQSFARSETEGRGVLAFGINESFNKVTTAFKVPAVGEVVIGTKLAKNLNAKKGDQLAFTFASGRSGEKYLPTTKVLKISNIVKFKIHDFDTRYVFMNLTEVQESLGVENMVNLIKLKLNDDLLSTDQVEKVVHDLRSLFYYDFQVIPYWNEFETFLRAVNFEKYMIAIVLSVIVIMSAFNALAFIIYSKEKKSKEIFLLYSLGLSPRKFKKLWFIQNFIMWLLASALALFFVEIFSWAMLNLDMFELPTEVYHLGRVAVNLSSADTILVLGISFSFMTLLTYILLNRLDNKSLSVGLREEFS